ncbi:MAG TPA: MFS transporter, partial [Chlamydiales bacterium]|nr:MFS transporter [Chlamydiales bacterium]
LGYISFVAFVASLLVALTYGNHISMDEGWRSPLIVGLFAIALIAFLSFVIIERNSAHPFFPFALFKDFSFSMGCLTLFFIGMAIFTSATFMLTYLEEALLYDKLHTGLAIFSYGISISIFSVLGNLLTRKISPAYLGIFGLGILSLSFFLNNLLSFQSGKIMINILLILRGMGIGLSLGPMNAYSLHNVPKESITDGTTLLTFFRQVGATYGGTVLGIVLTRRQIFHDLLFAQLVNPSLPGYQYNFQALKTHLINVAGSTPIEAEKQAKFLIIQNIKTQSLIQAINDALILFGYLTLCIIIILIIYSVRNYFNKKIALSK